MRYSALLAATIAGFAMPLSGHAQTIFFDDFEQTIHNNWVGWEDVSWVPGTAGCDQPQNCWGPQMLFNSDSHAHDGSLGARQEQAQPAWYGSMHDEPELLVTDQAIRVSVWQFEDYNKRVPFEPGQPGYQSHDQVQGWLAVMNEDETEFFALGVHAHWLSPSPRLDWWTYIAWATTSDGWNLTPVPRAQGWRHLEIVLYPHGGPEGDVEFYVDGQLVGSGRRQRDGSCEPVPVSRIAIGSSPAHVAEDYISNTYEFFWYDEATISLEAPGPQCPNPELRFDADADGDVDQDDFAVFQRCYTGTDDPGGAFDCLACRCMDADSDLDVDALDYDGFEACASGPAVAADISCDDGVVVVP